ncbi:MAG: EAL domain-containing protein [Campylobacterales bacterium]|nr:EAL domain-containing protein [Campylobacterales bacterium]
MKYSISIKVFSISIVFLLLIALSFVFFNFHTTSKKNIEELLESHIQTSVLNLKHYLDKNVKVDNVSDIVSHLDTITSVNSIIANIKIDNEKHETLYLHSRTLKNFDKKECVPIFEISQTNVFSNSCYTIHTKLYRGLTPFYYTTYIIISQKYLNSLLHNQTQKLFLEYFATIFILLFLTWLTFSQIIKNPLERLRQFAYYESKIPHRFFIQEIESIRHSLEMTFKRLHQEQKELYNLSTRDQLSGLYNKRTLIEKIEWLCIEKKRTKENFAIIFLDLDNFKTVNDSMGHNIGDKVLQETSQLLVNAISKNDIAARIGGDEFVIVLPNIESDMQIIEILDKVKKNIQYPLILQSVKYTITASVGVALFPKDGKDVNELLKNADIAMYKSKELGKNNYHFFTESLNNEIQYKVTMQNMLIEALEHNFFELHYQPKIDIRTQKVYACEALIRLRHPKKGLISPHEFISIAEENNFIIELGYWIIKESVRQVKSWIHTPFEHIKISINLSVKQFEDPNLIKKLSEFTQDINRASLDIELTESVFVNSIEHQQEIIHQIKTLGFSLSLDDFGTGYSSLSYLKNIPFNTIKIDKAFIDDLGTSNGQAFVKMIVKIAKILNLEVVAEGVETIEQEEYLTSIECDTYQGYLCSKPLPSKEFEVLLQTQEYL